MSIKSRVSRTLGIIARLNNSAAATSPRRRWHFFRFSLLSLLLFVLAIGDGVTVWWRWEAWRPLKKISVQDRREQYSFSTDQTRLLCLGDGNSLVVDVESGNVLDRDRRGVALSPDGKQIVTCDSYTAQLILSDVGTKSRTSGNVLIEQFQYSNTFVIFSNDSKALLYTCEGQPLKLWNLGEKRAISLQSPLPIQVQNAGFTPDCRLVYALGSDGALHFWDGMTGEHHREIPAAGHAIELAMM